MRPLDGLDIATMSGDARRGLSVSLDDMAIAAMVVAPFALTLAVLVGWITWAPSLVLIAVFAVAQVVATFWNAGWRARTEYGRPGSCGRDPMLKIENLHVRLEEEDKAILKGVDLEVKAGEVHAVMGPNGSGKSTLSYVLAGRDGYTVTEGTATLDGIDLLAIEPEARAALGLFLAFQYPVEIPGVGNMTFLGPR